jgi:DNA-directed RNA polymerase I, II, and III subunit RPABC2
MSDDERSDFDDSETQDSDEEMEEEYLLETEEADLIENDEEVLIEGDPLWAEDEYDELESTTSNVDSEVREPEKKKKLTKPYMTKFEFTKIIGVRAEQIMQGAQVYADSIDNSPIAIAVSELREKKIPLIIRRKLMDKHKIFYEDWKIEEFENIENLLSFYNY